MIIPNIWKNKNAPNHQPVTIIYGAWLASELCWPAKKEIRAPIFLPVDKSCSWYLISWQEGSWNHEILLRNHESLHEIVDIRGS